MAELYKRHNIGLIALRKCASTALREAFGGEPVADLSGVYFSMTFVRNPLARFVSGWADLVRDPERYYAPLNRSGITAGMSISALVDTVCATADHQLDPHFRSQTAELIEHRPDYIGRVETLSADWRLFMGLAGERQFVEPAVMRTSEHRPWPRVLTRSQVDQLGERFGDDVVLWRSGYLRPF